jgi:site-specific recombinase XerC
MGRYLGEGQKTMTAPRLRTRQPKRLDAGIFQAEISSFALHLAAGNKSAKTIRTYTEAVQWFAAAHLLQQDSRDTWEQVDGHDIQQWMSWLLDRYSSAYASNQYRALQQLFKWLAAEDELPDPTAGLQPPPVPQQLIPVFTGQELTRLEHACAGRSFAQRRDTAIIAVFKATGIRLSELAGLRYDPGDPRRSDIDLWQREITVRGKGGKPRIVRIGHQAARKPGPVPPRPLPPSAGVAAAAVARREQPGAADRRRHLPDDRPPWPPVQCGRAPPPVPAPLQSHLAGPRRTRRRPDGTQRLGLPADAPPLRRQRPQRPRPPHLRPHHDRHLMPPLCEPPEASGVPHKNPTNPRPGPPPQVSHFSGGRSSLGPPGQRQQDSLPYLRKRRKAKATMGIEPHPRGSSHPRERRAADRHATADPAEESKTMTVLRRRPRLPGQPRQLDAGPLEPQIGSFALHLAAEGKAARTVQGYTSAVRWFAAATCSASPARPAGSRSTPRISSGG